nr:MAG: Putative binding domain, N-terminal [Bacteriophage sp.]
MGEIATWSAVKTKVGLGKTGNDCPTKAELLALSSTGTGENYVGLELSNASSYGNNECVKLEDIHKVTYKYTFTSRYSSISFDALGNPSSSNQGFGFISTKQKYWDGIANGAEVTVNYTISNTPTWVTNHGNQVPPWTASENLGLTSRSDSNTLVTQSESGKTFKVTFTQAAASQSWSYGFSVNPTSMSFGATGGTKTFTVTSYKQELRNGHNYGNQISLTYTRANGGSISGTGTSVTMGNNTSTSTRSGTVTLTQAETNKKVTISCSQSAGYKTYSEITASGGAVTDIPASGGTRSSFTTLPTYSQTWGWNGSTTGGGTITTGASISYGTAVSASSLEDTVKSRTQVGTLTGTLSLNGKTKSVSIPVFQGANQWEGYSYGSSWSVTLTASSYTISNTGGSVTLYPSASRDRYSNYTSGYTVRDGYDTADPSLSTNGISGFTLSGTTLTASLNSSTDSRTIKVFANYEGASDYVYITQGGASVSYNYYFYWNGMATSESVYHAAVGDTLYRYFSSYKTKVINGSESEDIYEVGVSLSGAPSWATVSASSGKVTSKASENVEESSRSATVTVTQNESGEKITLFINQSAATITYEYVFELSPV